ncbi:MAG: hypothetical protein Q4F34_04850, partial [Prevotellaceae bacterium]|nr:hypothetical protein [Prevotellaceae bacterium]
MNKKFNSIKKLSRGVMLLLTTLSMSTSVAYADGETTTPQIVIGGDVYGGGKEGIVGTGNLRDGIAKDANEDAIALNAATAGAIETTFATEVKVYDGKIRTIFAGGRNGRVFGTTSATICGGTIGGEEWEGTTHGGVFGAGDGASAVVFGCGRVTVEDGTVWNSINGGGNQAELLGNTLVTLKGGRMYGNVYGGARMADIITYAHVLIDGAHQQNDLFVKGVYGGGDIAGSLLNMTRVQTNIGKGYWNWFMSMSQYAGKAMKADSDKAEWMQDITVKDESSPYAPTKHPNRAINVNQIWNTIVESTPKAEDNDMKLFVGNTFGAGNGAYDYVYAGSSTSGSLTLPFHKVLDSDGKWVVDTDYLEDANGDRVTTGGAYQKTFNNLLVPNTDRTYLQLEGGTYGYVYGGGNNTTVYGSVDIYINNADRPCEIPALEMERMGLQTTTYTLWNGEDSLSRLEYADLTAAEKENVVAKVPQTFDRVFGGNNLAEMPVAPNWYLIQGRVNNLYSGGNKGNMTSGNGILVNIFKNNGTYDIDPVKKVRYPVDAMMINNIYGGCRMANVAPGTTSENGPDGFRNFGYNFLSGYAARVYISGGHINNVYGGNDVSGHVAYGTDVEIHGAISGDVYGGGNGAYPYTDNATLATDYPDEWGDYYYDANGGLDLDNPVTSATASLEGLYKKRPHVENTLVHIAGEGTYLSPSDWETKYGSNVKTGAAVAKYYWNEDGTKTIVQLNPEAGDYDATEAAKPGQLIAKGEMEDINRVYVLGGVYCGGNSATLVDGADGRQASATFQIGQCVTMDKIFLGSNGEKMVDVDLLTKYSQDETIGGVIQDNNVKYKLAKFDLTNSVQMAKYMEGCAMNIMPAITYDNPDRVFTNNPTDADYFGKYSDNFGGKTTPVTEDQVGDEIDVSVDANADMDEQGLNFSTHIGSFFCGGNVGSINVEGTIGEATGLKFPRELVIFDKVVGGCNNANVPYREGINAFFQGGVTGAPGDPIAFTGPGTNTSTTIYDNDPGLKIQLYVPCRMEPRKLNKTTVNGFVEINKIEPEPWSAPTVISDYGIESDVKGPVQILDRGNIYGGCYESGYVNGSVQIQIKDELCATAQMRAYFGDKPFVGQVAGSDGTAQIVDNMRRYVLNHGWSAFGGGYGKETEIWGNVYMDLSRNAGYINAYAGSQLGFIGKMQRYTEAGSATVIARDEHGQPILDGGNYTTTTKNVVPGEYKTTVSE